MALANLPLLSPRERALIASATALAIAIAAPARGAEAQSLHFSLHSATLVGDAACSACHQDRARAFHETAHARTSSLPSDKTVLGRFGEGSNVLRTVNPNLFFAMESNERGFFQTAHMKTSQTEELSRSERIGIVVGSGRKGQTYLYWDGDQLFQLPVSYWTELDGWVNSPGFTDGTADFDRPIVPRCLECHASSFENRPPPENRYGPASLVLGISCERCHGPGSEHVSRFQSKSPPKLHAEYAIVNPLRLSRARQIDVCALCHEGAGNPLAPALSFIPGDDLGRYLAFSRVDDKARVDVHARQVPLMERSRCFKESTTLTCVTCHDVHAPQRDTASFAIRCLACHKVESCGKFAKLGHSISTQCIDCHMPLQNTGKVMTQVGGNTVRPMVRNHHIAIYPEAALP